MDGSEDGSNSQNSSDNDENTENGKYTWEISVRQTMLFSRKLNRSGDSSVTLLTCIGYGKKI